MLDMYNISRLRVRKILQYLSILFFYLRKETIFFHNFFLNYAFLIV